MRVLDVATLAALLFGVGDLQAQWGYVRETKQTEYMQRAADICRLSGCRGSRREG